MTYGQIIIAGLTLLGFLMGQLILAIWWASKITIILEFVQKELVKITETSVRQDERIEMKINALWKKVDGNTQRLDKCAYCNEISRGSNK